jgi:hypothetical protein
MREIFIFFNDIREGQENTWTALLAGKGKIVLLKAAHSESL